MNVQFVLSGLALANLAAGAAADTTYTVNLSGPTTSGPPGVVAVNGTIRVDAIGVITPANLVDWSLTFSSPNSPNSLLTRANSEADGFGAFGLTATARSLLITIAPSASTESESGGFFISDTAPFPTIIGLQYQGGDGSTTQLILDHALPSRLFTQHVSELGDGGDFVIGTVSQSGLPGDYNNDRVVDAADYTVWRDNVGAAAGALVNDIDGGPIGEAQYAIWRASFGAAVPVVGALAATSVPEPTTVLLGLGGVAIFTVRRPRRTFL